MCRNSKNGVKRTVLLFCVFALLVSPCFARASWEGLFGVKGHTASLAVEPQDSPKVSSPESSEAESTAQSETVSQSNYQTLLNQSKKLATEYSELDKELLTIYNSLQTLKTQLETYRATDAISEEEYNTLATLLEATTEEGAVYEKVANNLAEENAKLKDKISKVKEKVFRPYTLVGVGFDFETLVPILSANVAFGAKIGNLMVQVGADYRIGDIKTLDFGDAFNLNRLRASIAVGYMF